MSRSNAAMIAAARSIPTMPLALIELRVGKCRQEAFDIQAAAHVLHGWLNHGPSLDGNDVDILARLAADLSKRLDRLADSLELIHLESTREASAEEREELDSGDCDE